MDVMTWLPAAGAAVLAAAAWSGAAWRGWRLERSMPEHVPGELLVKFHDGVAQEARCRIHEQCGGKVIAERGIGKLHHVKGGRASRSARLLRDAYHEHPEVEYAEPNYIYRSCLAPNDAFYPLQYGPKLIHAEQAWDKAAGDASVILAVVDTGVDGSHPDLSAKLLAGQDFVQPGQPPEDQNGHGTHVAGIAAAATGNGIGIAGIAPDALVLPVRVLDRNGSGAIATIAAGVRYAADQGAKVINLSLGGAGRSVVLRDAIRYAASKGAVIVAAAGNDGSPAKLYPAAYDEVISVGSVGAEDVHSAFSNYGAWVDVAAPGEKIVSTYRYGRYTYLSGTSMAAPHVSGVAALLAGQGLDASAIRERLLASADPIEGTGMYWAHGRVNAERAASGG